MVITLPHLLFRGILAHCLRTFSDILHSTFTSSCCLNLTFLLKVKSELCGIFQEWVMSHEMALHIVNCLLLIAYILFCLSKWCKVRIRSNTVFRECLILLFYKNMNQIGHKHNILRVALKAFFCICLIHYDKRHTF